MQRNYTPQWLKVFAISNLLFTYAVILWGAFVRKTHSGAGCGDHWPLCNGEVIPVAPQTETMIEFTHRITSAVAFLGVVGLWIAARKYYATGSAQRRYAGLSLVFMIVEALLGAGLVIFGLVNTNESGLRAFAVAIHLANTFFLVGFLSTAAISIVTNRSPDFGRLFRSRLEGTLIVLFGTVLITVGCFGAIAALGNTLFPPESLVAGMLQHTNATANFLMRLKYLHPIMAIFGCLSLVAWIQIALARTSTSHSNGNRIWNSGQSLSGLIIANIVLGGLDVVLLAPTWLSLAHLLMADLIWTAFIWHIFEKSLAYAVTMEVPNDSALSVAMDQGANGFLPLNSKSFRKDSP
jgi:cytochrome c oxidase assembly protein subunit 15